MNTQIPLHREPALKRGEPESPLLGGAMRTVKSEELFRGSNEIAIQHAGSLYRLKITRQGKLILNK